MSYLFFGWTRMAIFSGFVGRLLRLLLMIGWIVVHDRWISAITSTTIFHNTSRISSYFTVFRFASRWWFSSDGCHRVVVAVATFGWLLLSLLRFRTKRFGRVPVLFRVLIGTCGHFVSAAIDCLLLWRWRGRGRRWRWCRRRRLKASVLWSVVERLWTSMNPSSRFELAAFYHGVGTAITEKTP